MSGPGSATPRARKARGTGRRRSRLSRAEVHELFSRLAELDPSPTTELEYQTPFELLVAVVLSAQATDVGVNKATRRLFPVANTPQAILELGEEGLKRYISTIGLFNAKAKNVVALCRILLEKHGGEVPRTREELEALPGVGRKTANVVLANAFDREAIAVDTHVGRLARRLGFSRHTNPDQVEADLRRTFPPEQWVFLHHALILHGRRVCTARRPACEVCPLCPDCPSCGKVGEPRRARRR